MKDFWTVNIWLDAEGNLQVAVNPLLGDTQSVGSAGAVALYVVNGLHDVAAAALEWLKKIEQDRKAKAAAESVVIAPAEKTIVVPE